MHNLKRNTETFTPK